MSKAHSQHHSLWEVYVSTDEELLKYETFSKKVAHITSKCTFVILSQFKILGDHNVSTDKELSELDTFST